MKKAKTDILSEISTLTRIIEEEYPELQKYLEETRSTLPQGSLNSGIMENEALKDYRDSLKELIQRYGKQHDRN